MTARGLRAGLVALLCAAAAQPGRAQDTTQNVLPPPADTDTVPPRALPVNGLLLSPEHLRYQMSVVTPDSTHLVGYRDVDVERSTYTAFPAWLIAETRGGAVPATDSLYLSYVDLRPLHWTSVLGGRSRMALEFTPDSVYGATSGPAGNQNIGLAHGRDLLAGMSMTDVVLQLMPHRVGRIDSVSVFEIDLGSAHIVPGVLSVDGEQDLNTPLGQQHCWVVSLTTPQAVGHYWVSETDPVVVQMQQEVPDRPGFVFQQQLLVRQ